jgi:hypothetical protein
MNPIITSSHLKGIGGHKKHLSHKMLKTRGIKGGHGRHESEEQKHDDYLRRQFSQGKVEILDRPMPLIDIGIDKINELIKSICGDFEDTCQNAWVRVIEEHPATENDILNIAKECSQKCGSETIARKYRQISMDTPLKNNEDSEDLTLHSILPSKELNISGDEIDEEIDGDTPYVASSTGKINYRGYVHLDFDTFKAIKERYPHDTLNVAIRKLVMIPPSERDKVGWHKWEDALIRVRYPWGGSRSLLMDLNRTEMAIIERAKHLGVKAGKSLNSYKPCRDWLNIPELADQLGVKYGVAARLVTTGKIEVIRIPDYHQGHDGVFITKEALENYKSGKLTSAVGIKKQIKEAVNIAIKKERLRLKSKAEKLKYYPYKIRNQEKARAAELINKNNQKTSILINQEKARAAETVKKYQEALKNISVGLIYNNQTKTRIKAVNHIRPTIQEQVYKKHLETGFGAGRLAKLLDKNVKTVQIQLCSERKRRLKLGIVDNVIYTSWIRRK